MDACRQRQRFDLQPLETKMHTKLMKSRSRTIVLACIVQCASFGLLLSAAQAQAPTSPFERVVMGTTGNWQRYTLDIPAATGALEVVLRAGTGDADLYVRFGSEPSAETFDCRSWNSGGDEICTITEPQAGAWHIGLFAYSDYSDVTVRAVWGAAGPANDWKTQIVNRHNVHRAKHCAPAVVWDDEVAASAQAWADQCTFSHDDPARGELGENLAAGTTLTESPERPVDSWYSEVKAYDFAAPGFSLNTGHFTQLVWKATTKIGCAVKTCPASSIFPDGGEGDALLYVCRYAPIGNLAGEFEANVTPEPEDGVCQ
jgi:hypothetical protein